MGTSISGIGGPEYGSLASKLLQKYFLLTQLYGIAFDPSSQYLISMGVKHAKYWFIDKDLLSSSTEKVGFILI